MGIFIKIDHLAYKRYLNFENSILFLLEEHSGMSPPPCHSLSLRLLPCQQSSHPSQYTLNDSFLRKISSSLCGTASPRMNFCNVGLHDTTYQCILGILFIYEILLGVQLDCKILVRSLIHFNDVDH